MQKNVSKIVLKKRQNTATSLRHSMVLRLAIFLLGIALLIGTVSVAGIVTINQVLSQSARLTQMQGLQFSLQEIKLALLDKNFQTTQLVLLNRFQNLYEYRQRETRLADALSVYSNLQMRANETVFIHQAKQKATDLNNQLDKIIEQAKLANFQEAALLLQDEFNGAVNDFNQLLDKQIKTLEPEVIKVQKEVEQIASASRFFMLGLSTLVGLLAIILLVGLVLWFRRQISKLKQAVREVGNGNLDFQIPRPGQSELGQVGTAFNQMTVRIRQLVNNIEQKRVLGQSVSREVVTVVEQLSSSAGLQAQLASEQAGVVSQVRAALEENGKTADSISQLALEVTSSANQTLDTAQSLKKVAAETSLVSSQSRERSEQSSELTKQVKQRMDAAQRALRDLLEHSNSIDSVVGLISNIAAETRLLALNGAIEAAGAGMYGERFQVVVGEIRNLAHNTQKATGEVSKLIGNVRHSLNYLEVTVQETVESIEENVELSHSSDESVKKLNNFAQELDTRFADIIEAMAQALSLTEQIKVATFQQNSVSGHLVETIQIIERTSFNMSASSQQLAQTSNQLRQISDNLLTNLAV